MSWFVKYTTRLVLDIVEGKRKTALFWCIYYF